MTSFKNFIKNLLVDEEGATAIEYALIVAMVSIVVVALMPGVKDALVSIFGKITVALNAA
ncbi:Flp family type IVb pilin [Methylotenera versatilis]|uniref:Flp family type IVb pilin n=1 Tax=Methylotenera versatilis TaxID=1055487 RepID=UPI00064772FA|nr:Flp family type IVb pilin [Methylotenera versatilis]